MMESQVKDLFQTLTMELVDTAKSLANSLKSDLYLQQIAPLSSKDENKFEVWIQNMEKYFTLIDAKETDKCRVAIITTGGEIGDFIYKIIEGNKSISWIGLTQVIREYIGVTHYAHHYFRKLVNIKQYRQENMQDYIQRIIFLVDKAYSIGDKSATIVQQQIKNCFIEGLADPEVKIFVLGNEPPTVESAYQLARSEDKLRARVRTPPNIDHAPIEICHARRRAVHINAIGHDRRSHDRCDGRINHGTAHPLRYYRDRDRLCWICRSNKHLRWNCPQRNAEKWGVPIRKKPPERKKRQTYIISAIDTSNRIGNRHYAGAQRFRSEWINTRDKPYNSGFRNKYSYRKRDEPIQRFNKTHVADVEIKDCAESKRKPDKMDTPSSEPKVLNPVKKVAPEIVKPLIKNAPLEKYDTEESPGDSDREDMFVPLRTRKIAMYRQILDDNRKARQEEARLDSIKVNSRDKVSSQPEIKSSQIGKETKSIKAKTEPIIAKSRSHSSSSKEKQKKEKLKELKDAINDIFA